MSITVGDLHLAITTALPKEVEKALGDVDKAATAAADAVEKTESALQSAADTAGKTTTALNTTSSAIGKTADAAAKTAPSITKTESALVNTGAAAVEAAADLADAAGAMGKATVSAASTAGAVAKTETAITSTGTAAKMTARDLATAWGVFGKGADAADDLAKATGAATTQVGGLGSTLASFAAGGGIALAVTAGISAIAGAYDMLTEKTRKAKEEQQRLTKALLDTFRARQLGPGGKEQQQVQAGIREQRAQLAQLRSQLADAMAAEAAGPVMAPGVAGIQRRSSSVKQLRQQIAELEQAIRQGARDVIAARTEATVDEIASEIKNLRDLEKAGLASVEQRKRLADLERNAAQLRDAYAQGPMNGLSERQRVDNILTLVDALDKQEKKEKSSAKAAKDGTDARIAALATLGKAHELTFGDLQEAEQLYEAEKKVLDDSTASIERRAKALQRMKQLEATGAISGPMTAPERQGTLAPDFTGNPFDLGGIEITGVEKMAAALQLAMKGAIDQAGFAQLFADGMSEAIAASYESILKSNVAALADSFASATRDAFTAAIDAVGAGIAGGWDSFKQVLLGGLGSVLMQMGKQLMTTGAALIGLLPALSNPFTSGPAMLAAGALIFGAGAALAAMAGGGGARGGGGAAESGGIGGLGIGGPAAPNPYAFAAGSRSTGTMVNGRAPESRPTIVLQPTIIGVNDTQAQRAIGQMFTMAKARGLV